MNNEYHYPVLLYKAIEYLLNPFFKKHTIVDGTTGGGSYSEAIAEKISDDSRLICIDKDIHAIEFASLRLQKYHAKVIFEKGNFADIRTYVNKNGYNEISGLVLDLGLSNYQLKSEPGFSYMRDTVLDMRADKNSDFTAEELVNNYEVDELVGVFENYGEIGNSERLAKAIISSRKQNIIKTTGMLSEVIRNEYHLSGTNKSAYANKFLSKIYQALRIEVNGELNDLKKVLEESFRLLADRGRIVIISYHSLEDRIVKQYFREKSDKYFRKTFLKGGNHEHFSENRKINILTKKVVIPDYKERAENPKSRSAKLRAAEIIKST